MSRYSIPHDWRFPIFLGVIGLLSAYAWLTKPAIEDLIDVRSIRVVALEPWSIVRDGAGCVMEAQEKPQIEAGDELFVAPDVWFLADVHGEYRTKLRNTTAGRNVYDITEWSQTNHYRLGKAYCPYHPIRWWSGLAASPEITEGAYVLTTEYRLHPSPNRAIPEAFPSEPFVVGGSAP